MSIDKYADIIGMTRHKSEKHPPMSMHDRAAQFSPFAALTGYDRSINEEARYVDSREEPDEDTLNDLDRKVSFISENIEKQVLVKVRFFRKDIRKIGGIYEEYTGTVRRIDEHGGKIIFTDNEEIEINDIINIDLL